MFRPRLFKLHFRIWAAIVLEPDELRHELSNWYAGGIDKFDRPEKPIELGLERIANDDLVHSKSSSDVL
jgi:hypothetical protein